LFRGGKEKAIRARILEDDLIECVILLPKKLFYSNKGAPGVILILNKNKPKNRKNKILFINAQNEYEKHPIYKKLNILKEEHILKIVKAYKEFKEIEGFSRIVDIDEIRQKEYNLNVNLYVAPQEKEEEIDILAELEELEKIEKEMTTTINPKLIEIKEIYKSDKNENPN
jgi:type I restriction enzyme M protein